jgi:hypothetical protein
MNTKTLVSALIVSFAAIGAAQAANNEPNNEPFQGEYAQVHKDVSRYQVAAELRQARVAGLTAGNGDIDNLPFGAQADNGVTRAQVSASVHDGYVFGDSNNEPFQGV